MDDKEFQDFLQSLSGLGTTATNKETSNVERGAFGLPLAKQPVKKEQPSLTDSPTGKLPVIKQATQIGVGIGTEIGKAGLGLGQTFLKGANVVSNLMGNEKNQYNPIIQKMEEIKKGVFEDPYKKELDTFGGKAGEVVGDIAVFASGNAPIAKGQQFLSGVNKGLNVSNKVLNYGLRKTAQVLPEAIGMGGIQYAISGGDAKEAGTVGVVSGVLSGLTHVGADAFRSIIPQTVKDSVSKIFVPRGKIKLGGTENITDDAVGALQTIKNLSPEIKVIDKDGIEKAFVPEKVTLLEMPQVLLQAKDKIYQAYSELATKVGDTGALFGQKDFNSVIADLSKYEGKGYTQAFSNKAKQIQEAINRYGTPNAKDGMFYFKDTPPSEIQTLIEAINKDVNPLSDKAGAEVSIDISRKLREILDDKISTATGGEYQQLRNAYGQLRTIEPTVINEFKKALRGQGIQSDIIDKIATVDTITGILSGNPVSVARGLSWEAVKIAWRKALGKEANLQRAFKIMGKAEKETPALAQRLYGNPAETEAFKAGETLVKDIKEMPNKQGGFVANPLASNESKINNVNPDLPTLKTLNKLEGRNIVSKQFISDLTNSGELKQQERDAIRQVLSEYPEGKINVPEFTQKVQAELLPLKVNSSDTYKVGKSNYDGSDMIKEGSFTPKYEGVSLPDDIKGKVESYTENIYESPIATSAGDTHFAYTTKNYFGHTRVEDMADGKTRRIIEVQSDLYQKGNLEKEITGFDKTGGFKEPSKDISKLQQYNDPTAHFRMVREELKKASDDGKAKIQFPTGDTAMKVEGLAGQGNDNFLHYEDSRALKTSDIEYGQKYHDNRVRTGSSNFIILDKTGKDTFDSIPLKQDAPDILKESNYGEFTKEYKDTLKKYVSKNKGLIENISIAEKIDTSSPIYKFYEKDLANYLKKFDAKKITDKNGVEWYEVQVNKEWAKMPVEAFGLVATVGVGASAKKK